MATLAEKARACRECESVLPLGPRPILQVHSDARILLASQAPGRIAHQSGVPFQDASGRRLRDWMGISEPEFYAPENVAILPMGFCYPGRGAGGDLPPRPECAAIWRRQFLYRFDGIRLTLVIGQHAQKWHFDRKAPGSVAEQARRWMEQGGDRVPMPHPSPRNNVWLSRNPWFETRFLPRLRSAVRNALAGE